MKKTVLTAAIATMLAPVAAIAQENMLLIIADDMGVDASLCYDLGNQQALMPNLEAMCANGVVFDNAYAAPVCSPTRATMMTGQYGFRTGVGGVIPQNGTNGLDDGTPSLFDVLADAEYSANVIGKWHLAGSGSGNDHPDLLGVSDYFGFMRGATRDYFNWTGVEDGEDVQITEYTTTAFTNRAIDWIDAQDDDPWFLWLAYNAPHAPFHLPPADLHSFDDLPDDADAAAENPLPYYQAMLEALDTEIGRLMSSMSDEVRENTIVIFIGDNGSPNQVTRGFYGDHAAKGTIWEGGVHIPFIVSGAGIEAGRSDAFVNTTDIFATVADIAGTDVSTPDSFSFRAALSGGETARDYIYVEHFSDDEPGRSDLFGWALREGAFKLVTPLGADPMLFNLETDPLEATDLLADGASPQETAAVASITARYEQLQSQ
jgi:arylsulfatase A-like enzyme